MNKPERNFQTSILTAPMSREDAERICAVEGLHLTPELRQVFELAEREGVSADELQRRIDAAFGF
nr:hypothetical protein [Mesorhizobium sp.]